MEWDPETKLYVGIVPGITGAHTQAATLDELQKNGESVAPTWLPTCTTKEKPCLLPQPDGRTTTVPNHRGRDLARPLIREILREIEITPEQFREELEDL